MRVETAATVENGARKDDIVFGPAGDLTRAPFTFDLRNRLLRKNHVEVPLPPRVVGVLELLLERRGELVSKQDLISSVWRDAFVTETSLAEAISFLRQTLGDDPQRPRYIQTLHRRGYRFIAEVRSAFGPSVQVSDIRSADAPVTVERYLPMSLVAAWTIATLALLTALSAVWKFTHLEVPPSRAATRFELSMPVGVMLAPKGQSISVSRDGSMLAFAGCRLAPAARAADEECAIYLRPLVQTDPTLVAGTTGGASPFFSRDGQWLGFFARGKLQKIALAGGSPVVLADAVDALGASWTADDRVVFADRSTGGLSIVDEDGRRLEKLTRPSNGEGKHCWPDVLPDGSAVVFTVAGPAGQPEQTHGAVLLLRNRSWARLLDGVSAIRAPVAGYLVAQRAHDLIAVAFDNRSLSVRGLPVTVAPAIIAEGSTPQFALAEAGTLAFAAGNQAVDVALEWTSELRRLVPVPTPALPR
jgi:DNA-binding winged helix-turn-helix (wHTH) protein